MPPAAKVVYFYSFGQVTSAETYLNAKTWECMKRKKD